MSEKPTLIEQLATEVAELARRSGHSVMALRIDAIGEEARAASAPVDELLPPQIEWDLARAGDRAAQIAALSSPPPSASGEGERQELERLRSALTALVDTLHECAYLDEKEADDRLKAPSVFKANLSYHTAKARARTFKLCADRIASALASDSSGDAGTGAQPSVAQACRCPAPVGVPCPLSESECAARIKANLASPKAGPA